MVSNQDFKKLKIKYLFIFLSTFLLPFQFIYSYNDTDTHPDLTVEMVELYNLQNPKNKLSEKEMEIVRQGSILEDTPPRWVNHFYNPETGLGWTADNLKGVPKEHLQAFSKWFLTFEAPVSSLNWAHNQQLQNIYSLYKGNHTWEKAVYDYATGKKEAGLNSLGYLLHLIEDASVPDHTRDDTHADISNLKKDNSDKGSPYESWAEGYTKSHNLQTAEGLNSQNRKHYNCGSYDECLVNLAKYSHYGFFSEDTIEKYNQPKIEKWNNFFDFSIGYSENNKQLVYKKLDKDKKPYFTLFKKDDNQVLSSYWSLLSEESTLTGAGIIELFFKEAEKAKNDPEMLLKLKFEEKEAVPSQVTFAPMINFAANRMVSPAGEYFRFARAYDKIKTSFSKANSYISSMFNGLLKKGTVTQQAGFSPINYNGNNTNNNTNSQDVLNDNIQVNQEVEVQTNKQNTGNNENVENSEEESQSGSENIEDISRKLSFRLEGDYPLSETRFPTIDSRKSLEPKRENNNLLPAADNSSLQTNSPANQKSSNSAPQGITAGFGGGESIAANLVGNLVSDQIILNQQSQNSFASSTVGNLVSDSRNASATETDNISENQVSVSFATSTAMSTNIVGNLVSDIDTDTEAPATPVITSPVDLRQVFNESELNFGGTAEAGSVLKAEYFLNNATSTATTSVPVSGLWSLSLRLNEGTTTIYFYAADIFGNISSSTSAEIFTDSTSPEIASFQALECAATISVEGCLIATTTVNLIWSSNTNDLDYFELTYDRNTVSTTSTSTKLILNDNASYTISLRAKDINGNFSNPKTISFEINSRPVIINEIAWMGTGSDRNLSNDEWIELYNRTNKTINLNNFILYSSKSSPYIKLQNQIPPKGYYLLERTGDNTVSDIAADQIFTGSLNNRNENLFLVYVSNNGTTTLDYTYFCNDGGYWCGGNNYATMERYNEHENIWGTNMQHIKNGKNAEGGIIYGTPKARNSLNYLISTTTAYVLQDTVLKKENSPYLIKEATSVPYGKKLTIEHGVVIKIMGGSSQYLNVEGELSAVGAENDPIVFTDFYDDEYGGDLNQDGAASFPNPGGWWKVRLGEKSSSTISYTKFRYGKETVRAEGAATIVNSVFENSLIYGLELINTNAFISGNTFQNNNFRRLYAPPPAGLKVYGPAKILNNSFLNNSYGIETSGAGAEIEGNNFSGNSVKSIYVIAVDGFPEFKNNTGTLNGADDGIYVTEFLARANSTTTVYANQIPYIFSNGVKVPLLSAFVVKPGVTVRNNDNVRIEVFGSLIMEGVSPSDIVFTSFYDPLESYWFGISANPGSFIKISGATLKNGGKIVSWGPREKEAVLYIDNANTEIENSLFENNFKNAIMAVNSSPYIKNTEFKNQTKPSLDSRGIYYSNSRINLDNVVFRNNQLGIFADAASILGTIDSVVFEGNIGTSSVNLLP